MNKKPLDLIFIAGAPGIGKSSIAEFLQKRFKSPCFEFGWIPEFRNKGEQEIPYEEEEGIAFENLILVTKNYLKHGFKNVIITDLEDKRIEQLSSHFKNTNYVLFTLTIDDQEALKSRVLNEERSSAYRDWESAIEINNSICNRPLYPNEIRINTTNKNLKEVEKEIFNYLSK